MLEIFKNKKKDFLEMKKNLGEIKGYVQAIEDEYKLEDVLVNDKRRTIESKFDNITTAFINEKNEVIETIGLAIDNFQEKENSAQKFIEDIEEFKHTIEELNNFLLEHNEEGITNKENFSNIFNLEYIADLNNKTNDILEYWNKLKETDDSDHDILEQINTMHNDITELHDSIFYADDSNTKKENLEQYYTDIKEKYERIVSGYSSINEVNEEITVKSYFDEIKEKKEDLSAFHIKIFGKKDETESLDEILDERLKKLKEIEVEAKKVINLSSDAGLAGGFMQRGKEARKKRFYSVLLFAFSLALLGVLNFKTIDFTALDNITLTSIVIRMVINIPFVWIAIVANINLNKYSRLEEEYAHKESLAKSFENYKEQINGLDNESSNELMKALLEINISAFKKNAAETMDSAKSDMPSVTSLNQVTGHK